MRTIAVGDIHGCLDALDAILAAINPCRDDRIIFLGDLVDRGPNSRGVIERIIALEKECRVDCIRGNHELVMIGVLAKLIPIPMWLIIGGDATISSYDGAIDNIPQSHRDFLNRMVPWIETETFVFVHAAYEPSKSMADQTEEFLFWNHLAEPIPGPHCSGKVVFCGHTPQSTGEIGDWGHLICIDTYCFGGQWLTALEVDSKQIWQADQNGRIRTSKRVKTRRWWAF